MDWLHPRKSLKHTLFAVHRTPLLDQTNLLSIVVNAVYLLDIHLLVAKCMFLKDCHEILILVYPCNTWWQREILKNISWFSATFKPIRFAGRTNFCIYQGSPKYDSHLDTRDKFVAVLKNLQSFILLFRKSLGQMMVLVI